MEAPGLERSSSSLDKSLSSHQDSSLPSVYTGRPTACTTAPVCFRLQPPGPSGMREGWRSALRVEGSPAAGPPGGHARKNTPACSRRSHPADTGGSEAAPRRHRRRSGYSFAAGSSTTQMRTNLCKYLHHFRLVWGANVEELSPPLFGINQEESFLLGLPLPLQRLLEEKHKVMFLSQRWPFCQLKQIPITLSDDSRRWQWCFIHHELTEDVVTPVCWPVCWWHQRSEALPEEGTVPDWQSERQLGLYIHFLVTHTHTYTT